MAIDQQRAEEADYLADKLKSALAASRGGIDRAEKIKIGLQVVQFIAIGVVGTLLSFYAETIKSQQQRQNEAVLQAFRDRETKAAQAKIAQEIMASLFDKENENRPKVAILIIKSFIDEKFALEVGKLVNSPSVNAGLDQIQAQTQAAAPPVSAVENGAPKTGWVYLGRYDGTWQNQYFDFPSDKTPAELERTKVVIQVKANPGAANFRSEPPDRNTRLDGQSVIGIVRKQDMLQIEHIEAVPGTPFMWARVKLLPRVASSK